MPKALEKELWDIVRKRKGTKKEVKDPEAFVYGTMRKMGWTPRREK